jgi:hypothetical protein
MKSTIMLLLLEMLVGCAQPMMNGYEQKAIAAVKSAEDNNIKMWTANACGTPFSAAIRNPEIVPALRELCLPGGDRSNPSSLLDAIAPAK